MAYSEKSMDGKVASIENNNEDWKEIRARVDSIANAMFLIGGGALSLSITVFLSNLKKINISEPTLESIQQAWWHLSMALMIILFVKIFIALQSFLLQVATKFADKHYMKFNWFVLISGVIAYVLFCSGFYSMILSATDIIAKA
jgi:hypothetical protein